MITGWTYILSNGGLRSLIATASLLAAPQRPRVALIYVHDGRANTTGRLDHVHRQAEHFSIRQVIELRIAHAIGQTPTSGTTSDEFFTAPLLRPRIVMAGFAHTLHTQGERLVWPAQFNGDFAQITAVTEQLVLTRHLADLEAAALGQNTAEPSAPSAAGPRPIIETPLIDLTDRQLIELGAQLDVPWHLAWSCMLQGDKPCRVCPACRRRHAGFKAGGIVDPVEQLASA